MKNKSILTIIIVLLGTIAVQAQTYPIQNTDENSTAVIVSEGQERIHKWSVYATIDYSYMGRDNFAFFILTPNNGYQYINEQEFRLGVDVGVRYQLNSRLYLQGGAAYRDNGHISNSSVAGIENNITYRVNYISPQLGTGIVFGTWWERLNADIRGNLMYNIYAGESFSRELEFSHVDNLAWKNYWSSALFLGLDYRLGPNFQLSAGPNLEINLSETTRSDKPWLAGDMNFLRVGFQFSTIINF